MVIVGLAILNVYQYFQTLQLRDAKGLFEYRAKENEELVDYYRQAKLHKINFNHEDKNFSGIVFNSGIMTAYNAKVVLDCEEWTYEINLGDIDYHQYKMFNEFVDFPESDPENPRLILHKLEWVTDA